MPNGDSDYQQWKTSSAEFRGFIKAKLEDIETKLDKSIVICDRHAGRINKLENRMTATEIKGGVFGVIGGIIGGFIRTFMR
jgi:hypothetical protein